MNYVLELKNKRFIQEDKKNIGGGITMNSKVDITVTQLDTLIKQLSSIQEFWQREHKLFTGLLVSVHYNKIAAKSNRISGLFKGIHSNDAVVGAKFNDDKSKHIITYFLEDKDLTNSIELLLQVRVILNEVYTGRMSKNILENAKKVHSNIFKNYPISMSVFKSVIADVSYIESFEVHQPKLVKSQSIVTLYDVKKDIKELLEEIGLDPLHVTMLDDQTIYLTDTQVQILFENAAYLVAMATVDVSQLPPDEFIDTYESYRITIPEPTIEPTIGVIDTLFDERVYFSEWVEYHDMVSNDIEKSSLDYNHGTAVSSIIVDGPRLNPWLDDGCGRFRVRHFGVAVGKSFSSYTIIKNIKKIIANNKDIKVWNISLGSSYEINDNFISVEAATLDRIQFEEDVIFVVAGTNKSSEDIVKIGAPADSINSVVVNAVTKEGLSTPYTRKGPVLSFFAKPDISYYGGSKGDYIQVCEPNGVHSVAGTSYASPWIARKLSYLIDILGLQKEVAKALLIDSARGWNENLDPNV